MCRAAEIIQILTALGFVVEDHGANLQVTPPSWRHDVDGPADLVEEVVRIHGLDKVPSVALSRDHAVAAPVLSSGAAPHPHRAARHRGARLQ